MIGYTITVTCRHLPLRGNGVFVQILVTLRFSRNVDNCDIYQGNHQWFFYLLSPESKFIPTWCLVQRTTVGVGIFVQHVSRMNPVQDNSMTCWHNTNNRNAEL
jgi:hypothetical protein